MDIAIYKILLSAFLVGSTSLIIIRFRSVLSKHRAALEMVLGPLIIAIGFAATTSTDRYIRWLTGFGILGSGLCYLASSIFFYNQAYDWKKSKVFLFGIISTFISIISEDMRIDKTFLADQLPKNPDPFYWTYHANVFFSIAIIDTCISFRYLQGIFQNNTQRNNIIILKRLIGFSGWFIISLSFLTGFFITILCMFKSTLLYETFTRRFYLVVFSFFFVILGFLPVSTAQLLPSRIKTVIRPPLLWVTTLITAFEHRILHFLHSHMVQITPSVRFPAAPQHLRILPEISDARRRILSHYPALPPTQPAYHEASLIHYLRTHAIIYDRAGPYTHQAIRDVRRHNVAVGVWLLWFCRTPRRV